MKHEFKRYRYNSGILKQIFLLILCWGSLGLGYTASVSEFLHQLSPIELGSEHLPFTDKQALLAKDNESAQIPVYLEAMINFAKTGGDASQIAGMDLKFFSNNACTGAAVGNFSVNTGPLTIPENNHFKLLATQVYKAGLAAVGLNVSNIHSIAVVLRSTTNIVPQADFTTSACGANPSLCCVEVDCSSNNKCVLAGSSSEFGVQDLSLKTTAAIGDPAEGGKIACQSSAQPALNLIASLNDDSAGIQWGAGAMFDGRGIEIGAMNLTDGNDNTSLINTALSGVNYNYAAQICTDSTLGGFSSGWFLPADNQLTCLYLNRSLIGGFSNAGDDSIYWSSSEVANYDANTALVKRFSDGAAGSWLRNNVQRIRCVRNF